MENEFARKDDIKSDALIKLSTNPSSSVLIEESELNEARQRIDNMLALKPTENCNDASLKAWDTIHALKLITFEKFKMDSDPIFDSNCTKEIWNIGKNWFEGMRHNKTRKAHGVCRQTNGTDFIEAQWKQGNKHGLSIHYRHDGVLIFCVYQEGNFKAHYYIRPDGLSSESGDLSISE